VKPEIGLEADEGFLFFHKFDCTMAYKVGQAGHKKTAV
jgi:hypothetical protein